jgi:DNA repair protein RecO (recombination protein O)
MASYQDHALVLRARPYREHDSLVTLFCLKHGKVSAVARGSRRPRSPLAAGVLPLAHSVVTLYRGRSSLETLTAAELVEGFPRIRAELTATAWAMALASLCDELFSDHDPEPAAFEGVRTAWARLGPPAAAHAVGMTAAWRLLQVAGLKPEWERCARCGADLGGGAECDLKAGTVFCRRCGSGRGLSLSPGAVATLRGLERAPEGRVRAEGTVREELDRLLRRFLEVQLGRLPRAWDFLATVAALP